MSNTIRDAVMGKEATVAALEEMIRKFKSGELACAALRVFWADDTWEDVVLGGDAHERAETLAALRALHDRPAEPKDAP